MNMSRLSVSVALFLFFVVSILIYGSRVFGFELTTFEVIFYTVAPAIAVWAGWFALTRLGDRGYQSSIILLISIGLFSWFVGEVLWTLFDYVLETEPFPSVADVFYLLAYPFLFIGFMRALRLYQISWTRMKITMVVLLSTLLVAAVSYFGIYSAYDSELSALELVITLLYPIGDLVLVVVGLGILMISLEIQKGKLFVPWLWLGVGMFVTLIADLLFAVYFVPYTEEGGLYRMIDLWWIAGYLAMAYGLYALGDTTKQIQNRVKKSLEAQS
jgi:hypothetical protein